MNFTETKTGLKIYEGLTAEEYASLTKEEHAFYIVEGVGVYKGETLVATASGGGATIINKTLSGAGETSTIESFTMEEVDTILNDKSAVVVGTYENTEQSLIFTQQETISQDGIVAVSLVSYLVDNVGHWQLMVGKMQDQPMSSIRFVEISGGLTEEQVQTFIDNAIGTTLQGDY